MPTPFNGAGLRMEDGKKSGVIRRRLYCSFKQHNLRLVVIEKGNSTLDTISHLAVKLKARVGLLSTTGNHS
jgi:hypothetical protein